jgi:hypothetical protein
MYGKGFPWARLLNQIKAIFAGSFNNYYKLPYDLFRISRLAPEMLAFPLKVDRKKFLSYLVCSVTPYIR